MKRKKKRTDGWMMVIISVKEYSTASFYYPFTFYTRGEKNNIGINIKKLYIWEKWCDGCCFVLCWMNENENEWKTISNRKWKTTRDLFSYTMYFNNQRFGIN